MAIEIFNRYEHKYKLDTKTFNKVLEIMSIWNLIRIAANIRFIP
mgnify:CR=1 FL=1